jgi:glycerol-3-phosphate dehydrogenase
MLEGMMQSRDDVVARLAEGEGDGKVLIVGGGINGIGAYFDLALQGVPALLVERTDFAAGTSSAPSRLIHGGLRYLETGEFALVRESVEERNRLLLNAPHLVRPIPVWVPALSHTGGLAAAVLRFLRLKRTPGPKGSLAIRAGLVVFDRFGDTHRTMPRHRRVGRAEALERIGLAPEVRDVLEYWDARVLSPERLAMELVEDAERTCPGSLAATRVELTGLSGGSVELTDRQTGGIIRVAPSAVVNCAGPWADETGQRIGVDQRLIGGTRGSHLVLDRPDLAAQLGGVMLYFETHDHRACLIFPLDARMVLVGTTDLRVRSPDENVCTEEEIDYLFRVMRDLLPASDPKRDQISFVYSGVRPLPLDDTGATGAISRDHTFRTFGPSAARPFPVITLIGGKWTTYRTCAEQLTDRVLEILGEARRTSTADVRIGGGRELPDTEGARAAFLAELSATARIEPPAAERLLDRYGSKARAIAVFLSTFGGRTLAEAPDYFAGEIAWIVRNERVARLEDIVLRRTLMAFEGRASTAAVCDCAEIAAQELNWTDRRKDEEIETTLERLSDRHKVKLQTWAGAHRAESVIA